MPEPSPFGELERRHPRRQGIPPSRTGARTDLVAAQPSAAEDPGSSPSVPEPITALTPSATVEIDPLVKTTIHLGRTDDALLNMVSFTGKQASPKVEVSRSAVVRLALRRLAEAMTPEEIVEAVSHTAPAPGSPGRPRLS